MMREIIPVQLQVPQQLVLLQPGQEEDERLGVHLGCGQVQFLECVLFPGWEIEEEFGGKGVLGEVELDQA